MKDKCKLITVLLSMIFCIFLFQNSIFAQAEMQNRKNSAGLVFFCDLVNVDSPEPDMSRLNIYAKVSYDELQFIIEDSVYLSKYELAVTIFDKDKYQVDGQLLQEEAVAQSYDLTNSRTSYSVIYAKFDLPPGKYSVSLNLTDLETNKVSTINKKVELKNFEKKKLTISDIAFVRNLQLDSLGIKSFLPDVSECIVDLTQKLDVFFEIYSKSKKDITYDISYILKKAKKGKVLFENSYKRRRDGFRTLERFSLPNNILSQGDYTLEVNVKSGRLENNVKKEFFVRWSNMPSTVSDIDLAIKQLKYFAKKEDYDKLKKAPPEEKLAKFKEFWKANDPTPGTDVNEFMEEYYRRVQYANQTYSGFRDGWKSDMGMIYIIFGPPTDVERHPFDSGSKPYEIWYYSHINRQLIFVDENGFGEYRLVTTGWENWRDLMNND